MLYTRLTNYKDLYNLKARNDNEISLSIVREELDEQVDTLTKLMHNYLKSGSVNIKYYTDLKEQIKELKESHKALALYCYV